MTGSVLALSISTMMHLTEQFNCDADAKNLVVLMKPATVVQWQRQGFRLYWRRPLPPSFTYPIHRA
jgi:hypothetical protein